MTQAMAAKRWGEGTTAAAPARDYPQMVLAARALWTRRCTRSSTRATEEEEDSEELDEDEPEEEGAVALEMTVKGEGEARMLDGAVPGIGGGKGDTRPLTRLDLAIRAAEMTLGEVVRHRDPRGHEREGSSGDSGTPRKSDTSPALSTSTLSTTPRPPPPLPRCSRVKSTVCV
ncbi:hypothetical protein B0H12DRAFT_1132680 [Mycena haematopus]|nr:hypothetical protein B0H12DRAFT_1132680 [Mycena haematopus]